MAHRDKPLEFRRIDALSEIFRHAKDVPVGIGDDCAVLAASDSERVWTVDAAVEGVHFDLEWIALSDAGYRAFMAAASDVAAMGAHARHALCAWTLPDTMDESGLRALGTGVERASRECGCPVVGGNLARGPVLSLTTSVLGELPGPAVLRSGGQVGDGLFVSGPLGGPRVGLHALRSSGGTATDAFCSAFRTPRARLDLVERLRGVAHCAIDLSDGLLGDLAHLCAASRVGARVQLERLPRLPGHTQRCTELGLDAADCLLNGGEEYELLFAAPAGLSLPWATCIGELCPSTRGVTVLAGDGSPHPLSPGFTHFGD